MPKKADSPALDTTRGFFASMMTHILRLDGRKPRRLPGFHASQSGFCFRRVILEVVRPKLKPPVDEKGLRIFRSGTEIHNFMERFVHEFCESQNEWLFITPFQMKLNVQLMTSKFDEMMEDVEGIKRPTDFLRVTGTGDIMLLHVPTMTIHFVDLKSANGRAFGMKKKKGVSLTNALQVATYFAGEGGVKDMLGDTFNYATPQIIYVSKDDLELFHCDVDPDQYGVLAADYWNEVCEHFALCMRSNGAEIPPPVPPEKWMCDYCSVFNSNAECRTIGNLQEYEEFRSVPSSFRR